MHLLNALVGWILLHQGVKAFTGPRSRGGNSLYWVEQPPSKLWFMVENGGQVPCKAGGSPPPRITWFTDDGLQVVSHPGIRKILPNGTLYFPANHPHELNPASDHATVYYCHASNILGTLVSKNIQVRAVINHQWQVRVYDQYVLDGNSAVMSCDVPDFVKDFVSVTSWAQGSKNIFPGQDEGSRVQMVSTGQLVVHNVSATDHQMAVKCRAVHTLTGETREAANAAHIYVTDSRNNVAPTISELKPHVIVRKGSPTDLLCPAYGFPPPKISWLRRSSSMNFNSYASGIRALAHSSSGDVIVGLGPVLSFKVVEENDAGTYTCSANNSLGVAFHQIRLEVSSAISVQMTPQDLKVPAGGTAQLECSVSGYPVKSIHWLKDGLALTSSGRIVTEKKDRILKVISVRATDEGIYQCKVQGEKDSAVASSHLTLGDTPPVLIYRFIEQTMQPGPAASLKCIASGRPTPSIKWTLDGFSITNMDRLVRGQFVRIGGDVVSHVNISNVSPIDGGLYTCTASNSVGTISHSARLNIYGLPVVRQMGKIDAVAGQTLALHCPVGGYPIHDITWKEGGKTLPLNRRQQVFTNGSLVISNVQSQTDGGTYECIAKTRTGDRSSQTVAVNVVVPPRISPFSFRENATTGIRLQVSCTLEQGDPPIRFKWIKDGEPLQSRGGGMASFVTRTLNLKIFQLDEFSNVLIIPRVTSEHSGNYTCQAVNNIQQVEFTAPLTVSVPPKWKVEPMDTSAVVGQNLLLPCEAEGFPNPTLSWRKPRNFGSNSFEPIAGGIPGISPLINGSLLMTKVSKVMKGKYLCEAINGIGPGLSKVIEVSVQAPPNFEEKYVNLSFGLGAEALINCKVKGDLPIDVVWRKNGMNLETKNSYRLSIVYPTSAARPNSNDFQNYKLRIRNLNEEDEGKYSCVATNGFGSDSMQINLFILKPPNLPRSLHVLTKESRSLTLAWQPPNDGNTPITKYTLQYTRQSNSPASTNMGKSIMKELQIRGEKALVNVSNLEPAETYLFSLVAHNAMGSSSPSEALQVTLEGESPSGSPKDVEARGISSSSILVSWSKPDVNKMHGRLTSYVIRIKPDRVSNEKKQEITVESNKISKKIEDLEAFTKYFFEIQAINIHGPGPFSDRISAFTLEDVPSSFPEEVTCTSMNSKNLLIQWKDFNEIDARGRLLGYKVSYYSHDQTMDISVKTKTTPSASVALRELQPYTNYSIKVAAFTAVGEGPYSNYIHCSTNEDVPDRPAGIKGATQNGNTLVVSWNSPLSANGKILTYTIQIKFPNGVTKKHNIHYPVNSFKINLEKGHKYVDASVSASTRVGEGRYTQPIRIQVSSKVKAKIISWGSLESIHLLSDATLPCQTVGDPKPTIKWYRNGVDILIINGRSLNAYPDGSLVIRNAKKEDSGNYSCEAENNHGKDSISYQFLVQMPPSAPTVHIQSADKSSFTVLWNKGSTGGSPLLGIVLSFKEHFGGWKEISISPSETSYTIKGLTCGRSYQVFATAFNKVGEGNPSKYVDAETTGTSPKIDERAPLPFFNASSIIINFQQWRDGGCPITHFGVAYRKNSDSTWVIISEQVDRNKMIEIGGLTPDSSYVVRITAHNSAGVTTKDYSIKTTTINGETPKSEQVLSGLPSFMSDLRVILPLVASFLALVSACVTVSFCIKKRPSTQTSTVSEGSFDGIDSIDNCDKQKEHFYSTLKKLSPTLKNDAIDSSDDLNSYASIQMRNQPPSYVYQIQKEKNMKENQNNYHYHQDGRYQSRHPIPVPHQSYCGFAKLITTKQRHPQDTLDSSYLTIESEESSRHHRMGQNLKTESDEYDTFGSDSDVPNLNSHRRPYMYQNKNNR